MKLKIETTTTQEKEIIIGFPTFTKIVSTYKTDYFAVLGEETLINVSQYENVLGHMVKLDNIEQAFAKGFETIDNIEFENALNKVNLDTHKLTNKVLQDIADLEAENEQPTEDVGTEYDPETQTMN